MRRAGLSNSIIFISSILFHIIHMKSFELGISLVNCLHFVAPILCFNILNVSWRFSFGTDPLFLSISTFLSMVLSTWKVLNWALCIIFASCCYNSLFFSTRSETLLELFFWQCTRRPFISDHGLNAINLVFTDDQIICSMFDEIKQNMI